MRFATAYFARKVASVSGLAGKALVEPPETSALRVQLLVEVRTSARHLVEGFDIHDLSGSMANPPAFNELQRHPGPVCATCLAPSKAVERNVNIRYCRNDER